MAVKAKASKVGLKAARAMPGKRRTAKAGAKLGARRAKSDPYLQTLIRNEKLHKRLQDAYGSARVAYGRVSRRRGGAHALIDDKKTRRELREAAAALRDVAATLRGAKKKKRRKRGARGVIALALIGAAAAAALSEELRGKVLGPLFGEERYDDQGSAEVEPGEPAPAAGEASPTDGEAPPTDGEAPPTDEEP